MFRWLVICTLLAAGTVTIMYVVTQTLQNPPVAGAGEKPSSTNSDSTQSQPRPTASTEERGTVNPLALITLGNGQKSAAQDRIVIPNGRVYMIDRQDVPSERDGKLICIATERAPGEPMPPKEKQVSVSFAFLAIELEKNEKTTEQTFPLGEKDKLYRRWQP